MRVVVGLAVLALVAAPASAILLTNGGFESGTAGWSSTHGDFGVGSNIWDPGAAPEGATKGYVQNGNASGSHYAYQTVTVPAGSNLTLTGWWAYGAWANAEHGVFVFDGAGVGGAVLNKVSVTPSPLPQGTGWMPFNLNVAVPGASTQVTVAFGWVNGSWNNGNATYADGLVLTPEPAGLALMSLLGIPLLRRRRA